MLSVAEVEFLVVVGGWGVYSHNHIKPNINCGLLSCIEVVVGVLTIIFAEFSAKGGTPNP